MVTKVKLTIKKEDLLSNTINNFKTPNNKFINLKRKYIESLKIIKILINENKKYKILYSDLLNKYEIQKKEIELYIDKININEIEINSLEFLIQMYEEKF